jgi:riboflavin kinase/FMN adenylyltransferase
LKVYHSLDSFTPLKCAVATTGTFDGVHLGHQKILNQLIDTAEKEKGESVLLTFHPHPRLILQPDVELKLLSSLEEKISLLSETGLDHLIILPFTKAFSRTPSLDFVREILVNRIGVKHLVIGYDHHFGRNREGSFEHLKEFGPTYGFTVQEISALDIDQVNVSSTKIRAALKEGNVELAETYLGHPYTISAPVVKGDQLGRTIGFPTANLDINFSHKLIPADGVYAGFVGFNGMRYVAIANIGRRPTVQSEERKVEVHAIGLEGDLYGVQLNFEIKFRLRDVMKFDSLDLLKAQLEQDKVIALQRLA